MKLFRTLFNLAALPVAIVVDVVTALPDASTGRGVFERTKDKCDDIDDSLEAKRG